VLKEGREELTFDQEKTFITYSGDTRVLSADMVPSVTYLIHESTFLTSDEKENQFHSSLEEVIELISQVRPEIAILYHFSSRYTRRDIDYRLTKLLRKFDTVNTEIRIVYPDGEFRID
jgi:ribonuclease Z